MPAIVSARNFLQVLKANIRNQNCKDNQNRCADHKRQKSKVESCCPIAGHHPANADYYAQCSQNIRGNQGTHRIIKALVNQHTAKLPLCHADTLYHGKFFLPGHNRRYH